ncbi:hypothetical protein OEA41_005536 [Lepraria neglecta]|uniref:Tyrosinase copper-binding domain-containing protein n=1 Tax=Lepraria neglecta TaxID=209136 RepID=A0AAD9Z3Y3_9LECA|nr:hypothetical protein OEA41_005536 [Lepraria neglecta]
MATGSLSQQSRIEYTNAVQCLQQKPAISSLSDIPGAQSLFDDFSGTHIIQAPHVHFSVRIFCLLCLGPIARKDRLNAEKGIFFHFHRYFIWLYEKALQEECDYKGTQPYWDWTLSWQDPRKSPVFDGSPTSLGSNGKPTPHGPTNLTAFGIDLEIAPATGGGCVYSGPFKNYTVNLGPVAFAPIDGDNGLDYNPRCLSRDISLVWSNKTKPTDVTSLISSCADLGCFDTVLEAIDGVHAGGHFTIGGVDIDAYASAGDPAFYLHHTQVDRVWTIWQNLNSRNRTRQVYGTSTAFNGEFHFHLFHLQRIIYVNGSDAPSPTKSERDIGHQH